MRHVIVTDQYGWKRRYKVRDTDGDDAAARIGVPDGPPDLRELDPNELLKQINNLLADNGFFTWDQLMRSPQGLNIVCLPIKRALSALYREKRGDKSSETSRK